MKSFSSQGSSRNSDWKLNLLGRSSRTFHVQILIKLHAGTTVQNMLVGNILSGILEKIFFYADISEIRNIIL